MRGTEHPEVGAKILKWIEGANVFEENIRDTLDELSNH
jgi:hypothetical protein